MPVDHLPGDDPVSHQPLRSGEVGQDGVEQVGPLTDPTLEPAPLLAADDERQGVDRPLAGRARLVGLLLGLGGFACAVGDPVVADEPTGLLPAVEEPLDAEPLDRRDERVRVRSGAPDEEGLVDPFAPLLHEVAVRVEQRTGVGDGSHARNPNEPQPVEG